VTPGIYLPPGNSKIEISHLSVRSLVAINFQQYPVEPGVQFRSAKASFAKVRSAKVNFGKVMRARIIKSRSFQKNLINNRRPVMKFKTADFAPEIIVFSSIKIHPKNITFGPQNFTMETTTDLKHTALTQKHISLGAKMVPFAGYLMPVSYTGLNDEHNTVRNAVGMFDVSHMGEFFLKGEGALDLIQRVTSNDASKLVDGKVQYSCLPNDNGGIVDDLLVYRYNQNEYYLVVNASNIEKDWNWIAAHNTKGVEMTNVSDSMSLLAVQGPKATEILQKLTDVDLSKIEYYSFTVGKIAGIDDVVISCTGYTGAGGFELYCDNSVAEKLWDAVMEAGKDAGIKPCGLGCRDTLRLEMGFCLYGNDIDDTTSPIEAGLGWITKFTKEFTNSKALLEQKEKGVSKKLVGFEMIDRGIPRHDYLIVDANGNQLGRVTSGTQSPTLNKAIGMGYVKTEFAKAGTEIFISIRDKAIKAVVAKVPFLKQN
jgi:aminomethyltransferase